MNPILYIALDGFYTDVEPEQPDGVYRVVDHEGLVLESWRAIEGQRSSGRNCTQRSKSSPS